jgi:predicted lysophospholipase L1 biosynthesis ABC-type transport system permease subunit
LPAGVSVLTAGASLALLVAGVLVAGALGVSFGVLLGSVVAALVGCVLPEELTTLEVPRPAGVAASSAVSAPPAAQPLPSTTSARRGCTRAGQRQSLRYERGRQTRFTETSMGQGGDRNECPLAAPCSG